MTRKSSRKSIPTKRFEGDDLDIAPDSPVSSPATPAATPAVSADPSTHLATEPVLQQSVEAASLSPPPPTPSVASTMSSPSSGPATPTRSTRRGGAHWRAGIRATLKQVGQDAIQPAPAQPIQLPAPTPDDEYDINSPHFGLKHTPKWDGEGIDIDDNSKGRWFPSGLVGPPCYEYLTSAAKLMLIHELTKHMSFKAVVGYLQLSDVELIDFAEVYEVEAQRIAKEAELGLVAMRRLDTIRRAEDRLMTTADWDKVMEEEIDSKLPKTDLDSPIPLLEIGKAIAFLQTFPLRENITPEQAASIDKWSNLISVDDIPPWSVHEKVILEMQKYAQLGVTFHWDFEHTIGLKEYIESETRLIGGVDEIFLSDDEDDDEAEESIQHPIGHPKKSKKNIGRQFGNKPVIKKSDLMKMKPGSVRLGASWVVMGMNKGEVF